jgi:hypothetical protein
MPNIQLGATRVATANEVPYDTFDLLDTARHYGISMTALLEDIQPAKDEADPGLDAFERQLKRYNIRVTEDAAKRIPASTVEEFWVPKENDGKTPLRIDRWNPAMADNKRFFASNQPQSWALFPEYINRMMRIAVPLAIDTLDELLAMTTTIDTNMYQTIYLNDTTASRRLHRVGEGVELPRFFAKTTFNSVQLSKYGVILESTYEQLRRIRLPIFNTILMRIRQQIRLDLAAEASSILVNGDGNNNSAVNYNVSTLDSSAASGPGSVSDPYLVRIGDPSYASVISKVLTYQAFLKWRTVNYPLGMTTIVGRMNELIQLLTLQMPTINPTLLLAMLGGGNSYNLGKVELPDTDLWGNVRLIYLPFAPGGMLIGLNKNWALEMLIEANSDLTETDKDIKSQQNYWTISQITGFDRIISSAVSTLTFA